MKQNSLLIDFGASRVKSATFLTAEEAPLPNHTSSGSAVFGMTCPANFFADALIEHLIIAQKLAPVEAIIICSEMHGFVNCDLVTGTPREYFSWRYSSADELKHINRLNERGFLEKTGMKAKSGLPVVNVMSMRDSESSEHTRFNLAFIPDAICRLLGRSFYQVHSSLAHASGFYNTDNELIEEASLPPFACTASSARDDVCVGIVRFEGREIPLYGGYGDLQTSVLGVEPLDRQWVINLGTGSQIISLTPTGSDRFEKRTYFDNKVIECISHIPAGRALNVFSDFFREIRNEETSDYFWQMMARAKLKDGKSHLPQFDLKVFSQANDYVSGGGVTNINEDHFCLEDFFLGLMNSFVDQYINLIRLEGPSEGREITLVGNLCTSVPLIPQLFREKWDAEVKISHMDLEPSLRGLALKLEQIQG